MTLSFFITIIDVLVILFFFFQAEDGIRDWSVTGVQTCALPIFKAWQVIGHRRQADRTADRVELVTANPRKLPVTCEAQGDSCVEFSVLRRKSKIGRASCRERGEISVVAGALKRKKGRRRETQVG